MKYKKGAKVLIDHGRGKDIPCTVVSQDADTGRVTVLSGNDKTYTRSPELVRPAPKPGSVANSTP